MAVLLAWVDFAGREIDLAIIEKLKSRALERAAGSVQELREPGRYLLSIQTRAFSHAPSLRLDPERWLLQDSEHAFNRFERWPDRAAALILVEPDRVHLCRDRLGQRPLCYGLLDGGVLIASGDALVASHPDIDATLDDDYLADYFSAQIPQPDASVFRGVRLVPAGTALTIEGTSVVMHPAPTAPIEGAFSWSDEDAVDRFRALFGQAIAASCSGAKRLGISLSGGLDSSSLVPQLPADVIAVTHGSASFEDSDERPLAHELAKQFGLQAIGLEADNYLPLGGTFREAQPDEPSATPYREIKTRAYELWREHGVDVVLSGNFADHLNAGHYYWLDDAWRRGRWRDIAGTIRFLAGQGLTALWRDTGWRGFVRRRLNWTPSFRLTWLRPELRASRAAARTAALAAYAHWPRPDQAAQALGAYAAGDAAECFFADRYGMEVRQPYRHWPLVQTMLSLPTDKSWRRGTEKWLVREALSGTLPDRWRCRPKSADLTPFLRSALQKKISRVQNLLELGRPTWSRFVDVQTADRALALDSDENLLLIWLLVAFCLWQQSLGADGQKVALPVNSS